MPTAQEFNQFVSQPINNLIAFGIIVSLVIVLVGLFLVWKGAPFIWKLFKQQADTNQQNADTNKKLTEIVGKMDVQVVATQKAVERNTAEMSRQTSAIEHQTGVIALQGQHQRNYQTLVSDTMSAQSERIEANSTAIAELKTTIEALPEQLRQVIQDTAACKGVEELISSLRDEVTKLINQQEKKRSTTEMLALNGSKEVQS